MWSALAFISAAHWCQDRGEKWYYSRFHPVTRFNEESHKKLVTGIYPTLTLLTHSTITGSWFWCLCEKTNTGHNFLISSFQHYKPATPMEKEKAIFFFLFWILECHWPEPFSCFLDHGAPVEHSHSKETARANTADQRSWACWCMVMIVEYKFGHTFCGYARHVAIIIKCHIHHRQKYVPVSLPVCMELQSAACLAQRVVNVTMKALGFPVSAWNFFCISVLLIAAPFKKKLVLQVAACWMQLNRALYRVNLPIDTVHLNSIFKYATKSDPTGQFKIYWNFHSADLTTCS